MANTFSTIEVNSTAIQEFIDTKIAPACEGEPNELVMMGLLSYVIWLSKPHITMEELRVCVMGVSEYVALALAEPVGGIQ